MLPKSDPRGMGTFYQTWLGKGTPGYLVWCVGQYHHEVCEFWLETVALAWCTDPWLISPL